MDNNNLNIDNDTMNQIKNLVNGGNISDALSKISPEMIQNFSNMINSNSQNNNQNSNNFNNNQNNNTSQNRKNGEISNNMPQGGQKNYSNNENFRENIQNNSGQNSIPNFDLNNIDMNTIMKISSAFGNMNQNKNDPRANLLNSLKPYLRDNKKEKLDSYVNLLNMSKIAEVLKNTNINKENNNE